MFTNCRTYLRCITPSLVLCVPLARTVLAQSAGSASKVLTLEEAVDFALKNYPAVRASLERVNAPQAGVGLARTNYLPRADILWQWNRATDNNITGLLLPQSIISPITGPVHTYPTSQTAWGSAAGLLFSWEPPFSVLAFPNRAFSGKVARIAHSEDIKTHDACRARCSEYGRTSGFGHVFGVPLACQPSAAHSLRSDFSCGVYDRGNLCRSHPGLKRGMGQRPIWRTGRRAD